MSEIITQLILFLLLQHWLFTSVIEKRKSTSPNTIQVKNWQTTISIAEKLDIINRLEKGEQIVDIWHSVRLTDSSIHTICDNVDRFIESAKSETKMVCVESLLQYYWNVPYQKL